MAADRAARHVVSCAWFWVWAVVGAFAALSVVSFGLGPLVALPTLLAALVLARLAEARASAAGVLSGAGLLLLLVAWLNRAGPFDPVPWLVAGALLFALGIACQAARQRH